MKLRTDNLHDAMIVSASSGPRREVSFDLAVLVKDEGFDLRSRPARLRFGAIENFQAVDNFVRQLAVTSPDEAYVDEIDSLVKGPNGWTLVLDRAGRCEIESRKTPELAWKDAG